MTDYARERTRAKHTTHAVTGCCLGQLDLPHHPAYLKTVRIVEANVPRITRDLTIRHEVVAFTIMLPPDFKPGTVVEWANTPDQVDTDRTYTVVTEYSATSVTFAHLGQGAKGALEAAYYANTRFADR